MGEASNTRERKSRKIYTCDWCGTAIKIGELYLSWAWFDDGRASTVRSHKDCYAAYIEAISYYGDDDVFFTRDQPRGCNCGYDRACCGKDK